MDDSMKYRISGIMAKKAAGSIVTPEETEILREWMEESPANRETYDRFISGRSYAMRNEMADMINIEEFARKVEKKIYRRGMRRIVVRSASVAAMLAVVILSTVFIRNMNFNASETATITYSPNPTAILSLEDGSSFVLNSNDGEDEWRKLVKDEANSHSEHDSVITIKIDVPRGAKYKIRLDDGTMVWLNVETTIEYPSRFSGDNRKVRVTGEAYFEVAHNPEKPFIVTTRDNLDITVLGTKFNLNNYTDTREVQVTLAEGSVSIRHGEYNFKLAPNRQAVFTRDNEDIYMGEIREVDASSYIAWINGIFDFRSETLPDIHNEMAKWYDVEFVVENDVDLSFFGRFTLTADRGNDFSQVQKILQKTTGLHYRIDGNIIHVSDR